MTDEPRWADVSDTDDSSEDYSPPQPRAKQSQAVPSRPGAINSQAPRPRQESRYGASTGGYGRGRGGGTNDVPQRRGNGTHASHGGRGGASGYGGGNKRHDENAWEKKDASSTGGITGRPNTSDLERNTAQHQRSSRVPAHGSYDGPPSAPKIPDGTVGFLITGLANQVQEELTVEKVRNLLALEPGELELKIKDDMVWYKPSRLTLVKTFQRLCTDGSFEIVPLKDIPTPFEEWPRGGKVKATPSKPQVREAPEQTIVPLQVPTVSAPRKLSHGTVIHQSFARGGKLNPKAEPHQPSPSVLQATQQYSPPTQSTHGVLTEPVVPRPQQPPLRIAPRPPVAAHSTPSKATDPLLTFTRGTHVQHPKPTPLSKRVVSALESASSAAIVDADSSQTMSQPASNGTAGLASNEITPAPAGRGRGKPRRVNSSGLTPTSVNTTNVNGSSGVRDSEKTYQQQRGNGKQQNKTTPKNANGVGKQKRTNSMNEQTQSGSQNQSKVERKNSRSESTAELPVPPPASATRHPRKEEAKKPQSPSVDFNNRFGVLALDSDEDNASRSNSPGPAANKVTDVPNESI